MWDIFKKWNARYQQRSAARRQRFNNWWNDKVVDNFHSETRDNSEGVGRFLNGIDNFWNRITGSGLTSAEREANAYSAAQAEQEYAREVEFYEKYQSPKAQMQQGVNPFGVSGSTGSVSASGGSPSSVTPSGAEGLGGIMQLVQTIFGMTQQKRMNDSAINVNAAQARMYDADAQGKENANSVFDVIHNLTVEEINSKIAANRQAIEESLQRIKESVSRVSLNNSQIEVNGSLIQLHGSERDLNIAKTAIEKLNAQKMQEIMPFIKQRQQAEIALMNAQTEQATHTAEKMMYDANLSMLKGMVEADLIDGGYYDELLKQMKFETAIDDWKGKSIKRDYKWKPVNDICRNLSMVTTSAAALLGSFTGASGSTAAAAAMSYGSDAALGASMFF